jgi:hypothetical protein
MIVRTRVRFYFMPFLVKHLVARTTVLYLDPTPIKLLRTRQGNSIPPSKYSACSIPHILYFVRDCFVSFIGMRSEPDTNRNCLAFPRCVMWWEIFTAITRGKRATPEKYQKTSRLSPGFRLPGFLSFHPVSPFHLDVALFSLRLIKVTYEF